MRHFPPKLRYKKKFKKTINFKDKRINQNLIYGIYGIQVLEYGKVPWEQLNTLKKNLLFYMKKKGKIWLRVFPMSPYTRKPLEVRMGKGKGAVKGWEAEIFPGQILYEVTGTDSRIILSALDQALKRFGVRAQIVQKERFIIE